MSQRIDREQQHAVENDVHDARREQRDGDARNVRLAEVRTSPKP
ncbi:MAG: hypothetical protein WKF84_19470 [Pyrinomonadaceae bacterium]